MSADATTREFMDNAFEDSSGRGLMLTVSELAYLAGTSPEVIEQLLAWDILVPSRTRPEPGFPAELLPQVRRIIRLHAGLGVEWSAMPLILDLLDRIAELEKRLAELEANQ